MVLIYLALLLGTGQASGPVLHFFYRPSCGHCMDILLADIPRLQAKYAFTITKYDIDLPRNYKRLEEMEQAKGTYGEDLPAVFIADSVFYGPEDLHARLEQVLKAFPLTKSIPAAPVQEKVLPDPDREVEILYFFQPGCRECGRLEALFAGLERSHANIRVSSYNILDDTCKVMLEAWSERINIPAGSRLLVPVVIIGGSYLLKEQITYDNILALAARHQGEESVTIDRSRVAAEHGILDRFSRFSLLGIAAAGLLDGVNPCAFATIIFFVSYLVFLGHRRRDVIVMAVSFISAVFIAYFSIGVGAYNLLKYLAGYDLIGRIIFLCFGVMAIVLGVLSLRDYFYARKGESDRMLLQLPLGIKQRIHRDIKERTAMGGIIIGSFLAGLFISVLEFGCTGQIYLPTITFMISKTGWQLRPLFSLAVYNIMFVLPLIIIAAVAVVFTTRAVARSLSAKIPAIKLLTALLFFALGILLVLSA